MLDLEERSQVVTDDVAAGYWFPVEPPGRNYIAPNKRFLNTQSSQGHSGVTGIFAIYKDSLA